MKNAVIFAHPDNTGSHNAAVLRLVLKTLKANGGQVRLLDLYKDGFDPAYTLEEYRGAPTSKDPLVRKYQEAIKWADRLVLIYPTWWSVSPAMMKGFFDRVFTAGFAFNYPKTPQSVPWGVGPIIQRVGTNDLIYKQLLMRNMPVIQHLTGKSAVVINTFGGDQLGFYVLGRPQEMSADRSVLNYCGITDVKRVNWYSARGPADSVPEQVQKKIVQALTG